MPRGYESRMYVQFRQSPVFSLVSDDEARGLSEECATIGENNSI